MLKETALKEKINELNGIELKTVKDRIENAVKVVDKFKTDSIYAISNFDNSVKNTMKSCFGTKDTNVCENSMILRVKHMEPNHV